MDPLKPLPPLPPLQASSADDEDRPRKKTSSRILSWATLVAAGGALAIGILHGMGASLFEALWHRFN